MTSFYSEPLKCPGVGRDAENDKSLCFYFSRKVSDDEMRFLHDVMQRAVAVSLLKESSYPKKGT